MKGPDGLKVGQIVYTPPDIDAVTASDTLDDFDTAAVVIEWPSGGFGLVDLRPWRLLAYDHNTGKSVSLRYDEIGEVVARGYVAVGKVDEGTEWYATQREAMRAAADEEEGYAVKSAERAALARRIAGGPTPPEEV